MVLRHRAVLAALGAASLMHCDAGTTSDSAPSTQVAASETPGLDPSAVRPSEPESPAVTPEQPVTPAEPVTPEEPLVPEVTIAVANLPTNLERLRALKLMDVGELLFEVPEGHPNCYAPCFHYDAKAEQFAELVEIAEVAARQPVSDPTACDADATDANLAALAALELVEIRGMLTEEPDNNPNCYNLPCEEDIAAAAAVNCERAATLTNVIAAVGERFELPAPVVEEPVVEEPVVEEPVVEEPVVEEPVVEEPVGVTDRVDDALDRLDALEVIEVGELLFQQPDGYPNCYAPCFQFDGQAEQFVALVNEVERAIETALQPPAAEVSCATESVDAHLNALRSLQLMEIDGLVVAEPANNPMCYNLPCAEDIVAAEALNCERTDKLATMAQVAGELFGVTIDDSEE